MDDKDKFKLEELIEELKNIRGRHTELVTVYIPAGFTITSVGKQLEAEASTASNIKSKTVRKNVLDALERIIRELKLYKQTPPNGMALFCGNVSEVEGQEDIKLWVIEPPIALKVRLYRCDQVFVLDPLKEMTEVGEVYGLLVMDRKEATIGLLEGKQIKVLRKMSSGVPGKYKTGGQCLSKDTLVMLNDGNLVEMKDLHNPLIVMSENFNAEKSEETPIIAKWGNKKELYRITTIYPKIEIKSSKDHTFFVRTNKGIEEKPLSEIKKEDYLIMPEKINLNLPIQKLEFKPKIESTRNLKNVKTPTVIDEDFAKVLGYYLGDGSYEKDRLTFFEQREEVAKHYKELIEKVFGIETKLIFRKSKNYWQLRIYSRIVAQLFKQIFPSKDKTLNEKIPSIILKSPDRVLASFISGFFDAEGYVSGIRIGLGINNSYIQKQLQFCLLRLGIISSLLKYDNRKNKYSDNFRYTIEIIDPKSLNNFVELINFSSKEKEDKLRKIIKNRSNRDRIRQIAVNGKDVARILRNSGYTTYKFGCPDFFNNKKQLNKELFKKRIIDSIKDEELKNRLMLFYNSNLVAIKIAKIEPLEEDITIDIETKNHNFIANGLIVHNSAARFERIRDGMAKEFYRRISEEMKEVFFDMKKLKGILVGGPIPTKEDFLKEGELVTALKEKVIGVKDIGYSDEHGLKLLVEASQDLLAQQEITHEKKLLENFFMLLGKSPEKVAYGKDPVNKAFEYGAVQTLLISKKVDKAVTHEMIKKADAISAGVEIVSVETPEGEQFYNLGGIGAVLRFPLQ